MRRGSAHGHRDRRAATASVDGADLARYLSEQAKAYEPDSVMPQSARNRFTGIVTRVERDKLTALVEIHAPPHRLVSLMTREAADELDLQARRPGDRGGEVHQRRRRDPPRP